MSDSEDVLEAQRHADVYATPGLPAFAQYRVQDALRGGRNPLTAQDVRALAAPGVTHILDLREEHEWAGRGRFGLDALETIERLNLRRLHLPVPDTHPPMPADLDAACAFLQEALSDPSARAYVHCRAGWGRTATVLAAFLARMQGRPYGDVLAELQAQVRRDHDILLCPQPRQSEAARRWLRQE